MMLSRDLFRPFLPGAMKVRATPHMAKHGFPDWRFRQIICIGTGAMLLSVARSLAVGLVLLCIGANVSAGLVDVLTSRNDNERTGANLDETLLNTANVNRRDFGRLFHYDLSFNGQPGGHVYAQPLYVSNVRIPGKELVNLVLVATTNNLVYAFDADGARPGSDGIIWKRSLGMPPSMDQIWHWGGCPGWDCSLKGPNIHGYVGIMSTPVIDRNRGIIFVMARTLGAPRQTAYRLHALDLVTGNERAGSPIEIRANASGIVFDPVTHNQRPGLALVNNQIIVAWGAHEDLMRYYGWVMSYRFENDAFTQTGAFVTTPGGDPSPDCASLKNVPSRCAHGGIWMAGRAPAIDADGNVLLFVGNGRNDMTAPVSTNFGNSFLKLDSVFLRVQDYFTPDNHLYLNETDLDLGGSGPMIIPRSNLVVGGGKQGVMHVWRADNLGRFAPGDPMVVQKFDIGEAHEHSDTGMDTPGGVGVGHFIVSSHPGHIMGGPVFWSRRDNATGSRLYHWGENSFLTSYKVNPAAPIPISAPVATGPDLQEGHPGGILTLTAHGDDLASGVIWAATYDASDTWVPVLGTIGALNKVVPGRLRAYSAEGLRPLWTSDDVPADPRLESAARFIADYRAEALPVLYSSPSNLLRFFADYSALRRLWTTNGAALNKRIEGFYKFLRAYPEGRVSGLMQPGNGSQFIQDYAVAAKELSQLWTLGDFAKFTPPTVANGRVYMATFSNQLVVYGLLDHNYRRPGANAKEIGPILDLLLHDDD